MTKLGFKTDADLQFAMYFAGYTKFFKKKISMKDFFHQNRIVRIQPFDGAYDQPRHKCSLG